MKKLSLQLLKLHINCYDDQDDDDNQDDNQDDNNDQDDDVDNNDDNNNDDDSDTNDESDSDNKRWSSEYHLYPFYYLYFQDKQWFDYVL